MVNFLKKAGNWILGKADEIDKLDDVLKAAVNQQTKRAFYIGAAVGVVATAAAMKVLG